MKRILMAMLLPISLFGFFGENDRFWVSGEALLWRPVVDYPYFTIIGLEDANNSLPTGKQITVCPSYKWGYRIGVGYHRCRNDLQLTWASLNAGYDANVEANSSQRLWLTLVQPSVSGIFFVGGAAASSQSSHYDVLDGDIGHWICSDCSPFSGRLFAGVRYMRVTHSQFVRYIDRAAGPGFEVTVLSTADSQGTGPRVGIAGRYCWCQGIQLAGELSGDLLIGSSKGLSRQLVINDFTVNAVHLDVRNQSTCLIIPGAETKFGVGLCRTICCFEISGEVGYQVTYYAKGFQYTAYPDNAIPGYNTVASRPFTIDGWYVRIGAQY